LGIATPLAVWAALGRAARSGVLFRNAESMERLARVRAVAFDKTGTLTTGQPLVFAFVADSQDDRTTHEWVGVAAGLGRSSRHSLSAAVVDYADQQRIEPVTVHGVRAVPGRGVEGRVHGALARLGSPRMLQEALVRMPDSVNGAIAAATDRGQSVACLSWNDQAVGVFEFTERLRPEATQVVDKLRSLGVEVELLTGDHASRAEVLARELQIPAQANQSPADKLAYLTRWRERVGPLVMVGDGLNDAPALAVADVGMAMGCGVDVSREAADVCLLGNDLRLVPAMIELARRAVRTIKGNLFWAFTYNIVGIPLALTGRLSPTYAALAMVMSSLLVVTNSARLGSAGGSGKAAA
jgi:heavy metal translocating P-type ATPase